MVRSDEAEPARGDENERLQHFHHWLEVNGTQLRGCTLKPCEDNSAAGLGVYTTDFRPENGILMVTPLVLAITPMTALQDRFLGPVFAKLFDDGDVDDRLVLMLYLMVENLRGDASFWAPYLKLLPRTFGTTLCFTDEELLELKGTSLYWATKIQQNGLRQHFADKVKGLAEAILTYVGWVEREVEFEDFLWANCIFWTRALNIPFPQSLVTPILLSTPVIWPEVADPDVVDSTPVVERSTFESENPELSKTQEQGSSEHSSCSQHHHKVDLRLEDQLEEGALQDNFLAEANVKPRKVDNRSDRECAYQPLPEFGINGESKPETTVWVEGLVPGIDFCNHSSQAVAVWEVDDQGGSASGVQHSVYLVTGPRVELPFSTEIKISYGNKGNEELLYLYGFVVDNNPDDYLMVHFPKDALEHGVCAEEKALLLEELKLPLRWLLPLSLLKNGNVNKEYVEASPTSDTSKEKHCSHNYSWSGHRKPPQNLERQVFPEELMGALRIIAMTEEEVQSTTSLLEELLEPGIERVPSTEDIQAAVWEVCGDAGALQLLQDLLTSRTLEIEEGTGSENLDADLLEKDSKAQIEAVKKGQLGSAYVEDEAFIQNNLMSRNMRACVVYRKGQKNLVKLFLQEAEYALQAWIS